MVEPLAASGSLSTAQRCSSLASSATRIGLEEAAAAADDDVGGDEDDDQEEEITI